MQRIYLDYAATTPVDKSVLQTMLPYFIEQYENPSALYSRQIKFALEKARGQVARAIAAGSNEIVFTSGGTEANNLAILGVGRQFSEAHFITEQTEHDSVLQAFAQLEKEGHDVTYLPVDCYGRIRIEELEQAIRPNTKMISIMSANNEIGTIQDISTISLLAREKGILFHTDAVQAIGQIPLIAEDADLISLSAHKLYAPKGVGALYIKKGLRLQPLIFGGNQESGRRGGTENITGIVGFGQAVMNAMEQQDERKRHLLSLGIYIKKKLSRLKGVEINGHPTERVAGIFHISIAGVSTEALLTLLDMNSISISAGSACQAGSYRVSHVLKALGDAQTNGHLRISTGKDTTEAEIDVFMEKLEKIITQLRT